MKRNYESVGTLKMEKNKFSLDVEEGFRKETKQQYNNTS